MQTTSRTLGMTKNFRIDVIPLPAAAPVVLLVLPNASVNTATCIFC